MSQQVRGKQNPDRLSKVHAGCETASPGFQGLSDNSPEEEVAHGRCHCSTVWTRLQEVPEGTLEFPEALPSKGLLRGPSGPGRMHDRRVSPHLVPGKLISQTEESLGTRPVLRTLCTSVPEK